MTPEDKEAERIRLYAEYYAFAKRELEREAAGLQPPRIPKPVEPSTGWLAGLLKLFTERKSNNEKE